MYLKAAGKNIRALLETLQSVLNLPFQLIHRNKKNKHSDNQRDPKTQVTSRLFHTALRGFLFFKRDSSMTYLFYHVCINVAPCELSEGDEQVKRCLRIFVNKKPDISTKHFHSFSLETSVKFIYFIYKASRLRFGWQIIKMSFHLVAAAGKRPAETKRKKKTKQDGLQRREPIQCN